MKKKFLVLFLLAIVAVGIISFKNTNAPDTYTTTYAQYLGNLKAGQSSLLACMDKADMSSATDIAKIKEQIAINRKQLKAMDFWMRYLEPVAYKKMNGPLPVEWET